MAATKNQSPPAIDIFNDIQIRVMLESDLETVDLVWRSDQSDSWIETLKVMFDPELCPNRAFVAVHKGEVIGSGFAYRISDDVGELGGFCVKPEYRNMGIGGRIWDLRMEYLGDRNILIKTSERRADKNKRLGFIHHVQDVIFYTGNLDKSKCVQAEKAIDFDKYKFIPIKDVDFEQLMAYDRTVNSHVDRQNYLKRLIDNYGIRGLVALHESNVIGYLAELPADGFVAVAPWYGQSDDVAKALLLKFLRDVPDGTPLRVFSPDSNQGSKSALGDLGLDGSGKTQVLLNKHTYNVAWEKVYSVCSPTCWLW